MAVDAQAEGTMAARLEELIAREERRFLQRQPRSAELLRRARSSLAGGVTSSWQVAGRRRCG